MERRTRCEFDCKSTAERKMQFTLCFLEDKTGTSIKDYKAQNRNNKKNNNLLVILNDCGSHQGNNPINFNI